MSTNVEIKTRLTGIARLVDDNLRSARQWAAQQLPTASDWMHAYMHGLYTGLMTGAIAMPGADLEQIDAARAEIDRLFSRDGRS